MFRSTLLLTVLLVTGLTSFPVWAGPLWVGAAELTARYSWATGGLTVRLGEAVLSGTSHPILTVHIHPFGFLHSPATIDVFVHLDRDSKNRLIKLFVADPDGYETSTEFTVEGETAPVTFTKRFRDLPAGDYIVEAILFRSDQSIHRARGELLKVLSLSSDRP